MKPLATALCVLASAFAAPMKAHAGLPVVYSTAGGASGTVPLGPALSRPALFTSLGTPYRSGDGSRWIFSANTSLPGAHDVVLVVVTNDGGSTVLREGSQAPWTAAAETINAFYKVLGVNDSGQFVFGSNTLGGDPLASDYIVKFDGTNYVVVARRNDPALGGGAYLLAGTNLSMAITNADEVAFTTNISTGGARFILGSTIVAQTAVTQPSNQANGGLETLQGFTLNECYVSASGADTLYVGDLHGDSAVDVILVRNNRVILHEGAAPPGMVHPVNAIYTSKMMSNGDWFVRGVTAVDAAEFVVRNSQLLARTGSPITTGASELFGPAGNKFFFMQGNNAGDYVIGGFTDSATAINSVMVLNGETVLARENDPVDLNNDGLDNDNAFVHEFVADGGFVTDDALYANVTLRNVLGQPIAKSAIVRIPLQPGGDCPADTDNSGTVNVTDLLAVISNWGCVDPPGPCGGDVDGSGVVNVSDLLAVISAWGPCP